MKPFSHISSKGIDYRIGVTTTTVSEPPPPDGLNCTKSSTSIKSQNRATWFKIFLTKNVENADAIFQNIVKVGVCGSGNEMGMESALRILDNQNNGFLRESAYLSVIYVSDEEDASPLGVNDYINGMRSFKDPTQRDVMLQHWSSMI